MIALIQRVLSARVVVEGESVGNIGAGLLTFIGVERDDSEATVERLLARILGYRVFADCDGKMNLGLQDVSGDLLLVPQFTLPADTRKGMRPSFTPAAAPAKGERLFNLMVQRALDVYGKVETGRFGADMKVHLINDGPVTFWLQVPPAH